MYGVRSPACRYNKGHSGSIQNACCGRGRMNAMASIARSTGSTRTNSTRTNSTRTKRTSKHNSPIRSVRSGRKPTLHPLQLRDQSLPQWLQRLVKLQQHVWVTTIVLAAAALGVYSWSVYSQQQWGQAYRRLEHLRRNERQLISGSEMIKNQIAGQVNPADLGLAPQVANDVIFLQPQPAIAHPNNATNNPPQPSSNKPSGY
jgi:hypothetical protein